MRCVGDVLAAVAASDRHTAREAAALVEVDYEVLPAVLDPQASIAPGAPRVNPKHENVLSHSSIRRGDADAALAASAHVVRGTWQTQRIEHLYLEPESALAEPRPDGGLHLLQPGAGDLRRSPAGRGVPRPAGGAGLRHPGAQRRRVRRQGGHVGPGADRAARARDRPPGQAHAQPRGVDPPAPQAPPDSHGVHGRLRRRRAPDGCEGADARRLGRLCVGRREGAGTRGRPRVRALQGAEHRHRVDRGLHEQPAMRRDARVRRQPGALRHGRVHGPAGEEGGDRSLGDPLAQRPRRRRRLLHRPGAREVGRHQEDAGGRQAALRTGAGGGPRRRHRVRPEEQRHRQRREGVGQGAAGGRAGPDHLDLQRLHRDGPGAAHGARAVRRRGDGPARRLLPPEGGHHLSAGVRPDDRLAGDAARRPRRRRARRRSSGPTWPPACTCRT